MMERIEQIWCKVMHDTPMWPVHGRYECRTCGRLYPVRWDDQPAAKSTTRPVWKLVRASK